MNWRTVPGNEGGAVGTFRRTLGLAIVGHALVVLALSRAIVPAPSTLIGERTIALEEDDRPATPSGDGRPVVVPGAAATAPERRDAVVAVPAARGEAVAPGPARGDGTGGAAGLGSSPPIIVHRQGSGIGLYDGLDTLTRTVGPELPPPDTHDAERSLREALAERDRGLGLARSGALVTAAHAAASGTTAPERGTTTIEVDSDATGSVTTARADNGLWDGVAEGIVTEMKGRTVRVAAGAGLRTRLRIVAELARPSGERGSMSIGAVSDDAPGTLGSCVGTGLTRKCVAGMPAGFTYAKRDLSNAGAAPRRVVHVDILSEAELR